MCALHCGLITAKSLQPRTGGSNHGTGHVGHQAGAPEHAGECGMPEEHPACEGTDPKERKDHSRAVEAAADHAEALGFRRLTFHFKGTHSAVVLPSDPSALIPQPPAQGFLAGSVCSPCDGAAAQGHPSLQGAARSTPPRSSQARGPAPSPTSPLWRLGGKLSWGRKEPVGLGVTPHRLERYVAWNLNTGCAVQRKGWGRERPLGTVNPFVHWA